MIRKDRDTAPAPFRPNLEMRERISMEEKCKSANWEEAILKFQL
jgi:hypothetical protein